MIKNINSKSLIEYLLYILSITLFIGKSYNIISGLIVVVFLYHLFKNRLFSVFKDSFFVLMSIWCAYMLASITWATHKSGVAGSVGVVFLWVLLYLSAKTALDSKEKLENFFKFQTYIVLFVSFNTVLQFIIGFNIFGTPIVDSRATDIFDSNSRIFPFILPLYIGIFGAMLTLKNRPLSHYILYALALFSILISIPISGTRGPIVILAIFLPIIAWVSPYRKAAFGGLAVLFLCIVAVVFSSDKLQERLYTLKNPFENQKHYRIAIWKTSFEAFKDNPILGVGFKNFRHRQYDYYKPEFQSYEINQKTNQMVHHSHSPWLDILSEQGLVGFSFMIAIFAGLFLNTYKRGAFMFISMFSVLYAFSFFNSTFVISSSRWSFFMIFAVTIYSLLDKYNLLSNKNLDQQRSK